MIENDGSLAYRRCCSSRRSTDSPSILCDDTPSPRRRLRAFFHASAIRGRYRSDFIPPRSETPSLLPRFGFFPYLFRFPTLSPTILPLPMIFRFPVIRFHRYITLAADTNRWNTIAFTLCYQYLFPFPHTRGQYRANEQTFLLLLLPLLFRFCLLVR